MSDSKTLALRISELAFEKKSFDLKIFYVEPQVGYTDYLVVCSARSDRQVHAIADHIAQELKHKDNRTAIGVEGEAYGQWILLDYSDVVVHVFNVPFRDLYDLDSLWHDAEQVPVEAPAWEAEMRQQAYCEF